MSPAHSWIGKNMVPQGLTNNMVFKQWIRRYNLVTCAKGERIKVLFKWAPQGDRGRVGCVGCLPAGGLIPAGTVSIRLKHVRGRHDRACDGHGSAVTGRSTGGKRSETSPQPRSTQPGRVGTTRSRTLHTAHDAHGVSPTQWRVAMCGSSCRWRSSRMARSTCGGTHKGHVWHAGRYPELTGEVLRDGPWVGVRHGRDATVPPLGGKSVGWWVNRGNERYPSPRSRWP